MNSSVFLRFRQLALVVILLGIAIISFGPSAQPTAPQQALPDGKDSTTVAQVLDSRPGEETLPALILLESTQGAIDLQVVGPFAAELGAPPIPNKDGTAAFIPVTVPAAKAEDNNARIKDLRAQAQSLDPSIKAQVTGPAAIRADLANVFSGANFLLLAVTGIIVAILLIVTYRSPWLWLIPLLVIGVADRVAATAYTWVLSALGMVWNDSTSGILSVLVFGAGTNYALLIISRYRDELTRHEDRFAAMAHAWAPTVKTIAASGATVIIGVACLLLSAVPTTRGLGLATVVGIIVAFIFAVFALPGILLLFGRWIFWPRSPGLNEDKHSSLWDRIGQYVGHQPVKVTVVSLIFLSLASLGVGAIETGLDQRNQFVTTPESISAAADLARAFPDQDATPLTVITQEPQKVSELLQNQGYVVRPDRPAEQWSVFNVSGADVNEVREAVRETDALVGGVDAQLIDAEESAARDRMIIFPLILLLIFIVLAVMLRALIAPAVMTFSVLLTNLAALGIGWWISTAVFGFEKFDSLTPLYAFVFLVALGIDYSIFLISRAKEEAQIYGTRIGVMRSLSATGGVITSAGILLAAVFAALGVLPLVALAQIGVIIFIGVLLDTLIVRTILLPAVVEIIGEKFWWPTRLKEAQSTQLDA
ncbi:MMPL family transporter [Corynebacterium sp. ES2775-CONJ]|uniref:MMPL family transporter n=1 Tax=Corynebacterium sp. ES2775-CONJ TaxID=2974029 RepID=UPI002168014C|nr:MMPL family transporter [Corynebacterium sp. ES2775-CONJ]MCS4489699.1 MMPL family transporter [Corynebacterium sp. ES2775-CONJ]